MLWWLVDNANGILLLLAVAALVLGVCFWLSRRGVYLIALGAVAALIVLVWVLSVLVVTDRKQIVRTLRDVAERINQKDLPGAFRHFADEMQLEVKGQKLKFTRKQLQDFAETNFKRAKIDEIVVWDVDVEKVQRPDAVVTFYVRAPSEAGYARCEAHCVLTGERDWRVKVLKVEFPGGGGERVAP